MANSGSMIIPSLRYKDAHAAIEWLVRAFGMQKQAVFDGPDGTVAHAQLTLGSGMVMLGSSTNASPHGHLYAMPAEIGGRVTSPLYLIAEDCEAVYASAKAAGAKVVTGLTTAFTALDPEGYLWSVGQYDPWKSSE
jgi:uncharacterized glyoxalase superfamily protein PhnB